MSDILAEELDSFEQWRHDNLKKLDFLHKWLKKQGLTTSPIDALISRMRGRLQSSQLKIAFVAEFSRGKSELINAIFFASGGRRIMPASTGRTTMCPVEIGYDKKWPACIRLLPIETRLQGKTLTEWCYDHEDAWVSEALDIDNPQQLAASISKVTERRLVTPCEAAELGLWDKDDLEMTPVTNALGLVEVPKWRHAIVNYPHPLLKRGISILDTPGLNTVGIEPELTLELLPQAHAILFILAADTGVTRSDLQVWKDYLAGANAAGRPCYVLLNKIDVLWDELLTPEETEQQLQQQRKACAALLGLPLTKVFTVSAQKGLLGKIKNDVQLLEKSQLLHVERMLVREMLPKRQQILRQALSAGLGELRTHTSERLANKIQTLDQQLGDFQALSNKNVDVTKQITKRLVTQKEAIESLREKASKMRVLEKKMLRQIGKYMGHEAIDSELAKLSIAIQDPGVRVSLTKIFEKAIRKLRKRARKVEEIAQDFESLLRGHMQELEVQYGMTLTIQSSPGIGNLLTDIDMLQNRHETFFGINQMIRLRRSQHALQIYKTLLTRTRSIFDEAFDMLDMWSNNSYSVLVVQVKDLEQAIQHLYDGVQRVKSAKEPLNERIDTMEDERLKLFQQQTYFDRIMLGFEHFSQSIPGHEDFSSLQQGEVSDEPLPLQTDKVLGESISSIDTEQVVQEKVELDSNAEKIQEEERVKVDGRSEKSEVKSEGLDTMENPDFSFLENKGYAGESEKNEGGVTEHKDMQDFNQFNLPDSLDFDEPSDDTQEDETYKQDKVKK